MDWTWLNTWLPALTVGAGIIYRIGKFEAKHDARSQSHGNRLDELVEHVKTQNGRIGKTEVMLARLEERLG